AGVLAGHGPSSNVSTTSPARRKSMPLKCSKPKPGPPVVSISTVRARPSPLGLPGQDGGADAAAVGADAGCAAGACARMVGAVGANAVAGAGAAPPAAASLDAAERSRTGLSGAVRTGAAGAGPATTAG